MNEQMKNMVQFSRGLVSSIWKKVREGVQMEGEEKRLADLLVQHEEYSDVWESGDLPGKGGSGDGDSGMKR